MIRSERAEGVILRLYPEHSTDPFARYSASCVVVIGSDGVPEIKALSGVFHPRYLGDLARWFLVQGHNEVKATRAPGHRLPGAQPKGKWWWWDADTMRRLAAPRPEPKSVLR